MPSLTEATGKTLSRPPSDGFRARLHSGLVARRAEVELALQARIYGVADPGSEDAEYLRGQRSAIAAALDYGLCVIERGVRGADSIPTALPAQARQAARNGIGLDTILRRYVAGFSVLGDFLMREADDIGGGGDALMAVQRDQAVLFDRLIALVADEYAKETEVRSRTLEQRRTDRVRKLLGGEMVDRSELAYEFDCWHIGLIAATASDGLLGDLAAALDRRLLGVRPDDNTVWAWLGGRERIAATTVVGAAALSLKAGTPLSIGEPAEGIDGWRLTHRQARAAWPIALRGRQSLVRYADVALLASIFQDDLLVSSISQLYLDPLSADRDGGKGLRQTLRAYFAAERNVSSTAAGLGVSRQTVVNRLHVIEERLGRPLATCATEMETALRLEDLGHPQLPHVAFRQT